MVNDIYRLLLLVNLEYMIFVDDFDMFVMFWLVVINMVVMLLGECKLVLFILERKDFIVDM